METPAYLLFFLGCLGGTDIALFHSVAHGIRSHPDSAMELVTHSLRGPTYAALFVLVPNFAMQGLFAWVLPALFVVDVAISIWDFSLERESRRFLGGLPGGEYVLHMFMAMVFGALVATSLQTVGSWSHAASRLAYAPANMWWVLRAVMLIMAALVLWSGLQDALAVLRLRGMPRRGRVLQKPGDLTCPLPSSDTRALRSDGTRLDDPAGIEKSAPGWMTGVLVAAGAYNLIWGAWVILFPDALFRWAGVTPPNYPQVWQCVGMVVGLYGIGYLIAAPNPFRHWPIILVGLLGKILGPAGMVGSVSRGGLFVGIGWTCLTNDLIWWVPFALILRGALNCHRYGAVNTGSSQTT